jgi:hypothetical protein
MLIDQRIFDQRLRLKEVPWRTKEGRVDVTAQLTGNHLQVTAEGAPPVDLDLAPGRAKGIVRLSIYDKIHHAAHADDVELQLTPLPPGEAHP